jgi:trimeric autotransporter adhesin
MSAPRIKLAYADVELIKDKVCEKLCSDTNFINSIAEILPATGAGTFDSIVSRSLQAETGSIQTFSSNTFNSEFGFIKNFSTNKINAESCFINNFSTNDLSVGNLSSDVFISGTGYTTSLVSNIVTTSSIISNIGNFISITGTSSSFKKADIEHVSAGSGKFDIIDGKTGHFSSLIADNFSFPMSYSLKNLAIEDSFTGNSVYVNCFTGGTINASRIFCGKTSGSSAFFTSITGTDITASQLIGLSGRFASITGSNIFGSQVSASQLTGNSAFYNSITGFSISSPSASFTNVTGQEISGTYGFFTYLTGGDIYAKNLKVTSKLRASSIVGKVGLFNELTGVNINSSSCSTNSIDGDLAVFSKVTSSDIVTRNLNSSSCVSNFIAGSSALISTITGTNIYASSKLITKNLYATSMTGTTSFFKKINATNISVSSSIGAHSVLGVSASLSSINSSNIYVSNQLSVNAITGSSCFCASLVGTKINGINGSFYSLTGETASLRVITGTEIYTGRLTSSQISAPIVIGSSAFFKNTSSEILTGSNAFFSSCSSNSFTGSYAFLSELVGTKINESLVTTKSLIGESASLNALTVDSVTSSDISSANIYSSQIIGTNIYTSQAQIETITGSFAFFNNITGTNIYTSQIMTETITGSSAFFNDINANMITSSQFHADNLDSGVASFSSCSARDIVCTSLTNERVSSINICASNIDTSSITSNLIIGKDTTTISITGVSGYFSKCLMGSLSGNSAFFSTITGTNIYTSSCFTNYLTGTSAFFDNLTATDLHASSFSVDSISGSSAFLDNLVSIGQITGSDVHASTITAESAVFLGITGVYISGNSASLVAITGSTLFSSDSIETNGSVTSGSINTFSIFAPVRVGEPTGSVSFNSLSGESMVIGTNIWNPDDLSSHWISTVAGMGGNLMPFNYLFNVSDDMKNICSHNSSRNSIWLGEHYISKDGGLTWYPCIGEIIGGTEKYDMNGGVSVSKDGSLWIATRISTNVDGGIYRSIDGISFSQTLSVPSGCIFKCCVISSNNQTVLVCIDSPQDNYISPFYISRDRGITWKAVIPSPNQDHHWISDVAISYDGKHMLVIDKNGMFVSLDYGNSWNLRGSYMGGNRKVAMSQDGIHMYMSSEGSEGFQYSSDFGHTWIDNSPSQGCSYSGVDCDKTGRYVYLIGDLSHAWLWFSNDYGKNFTMITVPEMTVTVDINVSSDGSKIMIYDGGTQLWFKKITSHNARTGKLTVNGVINCISGTFDYLDGKFGHFSTVEVDNFVLPSNQVLTDLTITHSLTGASISTSQLTGSYGYFTDICTSQITGSSCSFIDITGVNLFGSFGSILQLTGTSGFFTDMSASSASFNTVTGANICGTNCVVTKFVGTDISVQHLTGTSAFLGDLVGGSASFATITGDNYFGSSISSSQFTGSSCFFDSLRGIFVSASGFIGDTASFTDISSRSSSSIFSSTQSMDCSSLTGSSAFFENITGSTIDTVGNSSSFGVIKEIDTNLLTVGTSMFDPLKMIFDKTIMVPDSGTPNPPDRINVSSKYWYISDGVYSGWNSISRDGGVSIEIGNLQNVSSEICCSIDGRYVCYSSTVPHILELWIYVSNDFGSTYKQMKTIPSAYIGIASHVSSSGKYMSILVAGSSSMSMYSSQDYGESWNVVIGIVEIPYVPSYVNRVTCSYDGKYWVTYSGCEIYVSNDYGASYNIRSYTSISFPDAGSCCMSWDGKNMYCLDRNGYVYGSSNFGMSWLLKKKSNIRYSTMDTDSTGKYLILAQMNTGILELSSDYGDSFQNMLSVQGNILDIDISSDCSEIYILCSDEQKRIYIDVYKSRTPTNQRGNGILEVQGITDLNGDVNIFSTGKAFFSEISGSNVYSERLSTSSLTGTFGNFNNLYVSQIISSSGNFDNLHVSQLTGTSAFFTSITGKTFSVSQLTGTSCFFDNIYTTDGIQPRGKAGMIFAADNLNNCKFSNGSSPNSYFHMDSSSNVALFKVCNNPSANPMFLINGTADSNSFSTGALVVNGGVGVAKTINASNAHFGNLSAVKIKLPMSFTGVPTVGSIYFDVENSKLFVYTGSVWKSVSLS